MTFSEIIQQLPAHLVHRASDFSDIQLQHVVASDLMSDVLVHDQDDMLIVTSLASEQTVRTADVVMARGILLVNDKNPLSAMKALAVQQDITVLSTPLSMFEACIALGHILGISSPIYGWNQQDDAEGVVQ